MPETDKVQIVVMGEYKGHPTITLPNGSRNGFTFGLGKAKAILERIENIREFVEANSEAE